MTIELPRPAFGDGEPIPALFTCDGQDRSPPLQWGQAPAEAQSLALTMDDPDAPAGTWDHWIVFNLPPTLTGLPEGAASRGLPAGSLHAANSWGDQGYGGPCPPSGTHRYVFSLYASDVQLELPAGARKAQVLAALQGHILGQAEWIGTYSR